MRPDPFNPHPLDLIFEGLQTLDHWLFTQSFASRRFGLVFVPVVAGLSYFLLSGLYLFLFYGSEAISDAVFFLPCGAVIGLLLFAGTLLSSHETGRRRSWGKTAIVIAVLLMLISGAGCLIVSSMAYEPW
mgnify:CR=1 FL=1